jgi:hypothetical protein
MDSIQQGKVILPNGTELSLLNKLLNIEKVLLITYSGELFTEHLTVHISVTYISIEQALICQIAYTIQLLVYTRN